MLMMEQSAEEREEKMIRIYTELEDKRRESEREHEMNITRMIMGFMQQITQTNHTQPPGPLPPHATLTYPHHSSFSQAYK